MGTGIRNEAFFQKRNKAMRLQFLPPREELRPYIEKLWIFESDFALEQSQSLIAPNGKHKIIIPYKNALTTEDRDKMDICREDDICFIGLRDVPVKIATPPGSSGSIGIELTMSGVYKFINIPLHQLSNSIFVFEELYNAKGKQLQEQIVNEPNPGVKVKVIQDFLFQQLQGNSLSSALVDYSIGLITSSNGLLSIKEIERKTGYTKRYLDMMFLQYLGLPPKKLAAIVRFQSYYKTMQESKQPNDLNIYDLYYDQSHFIREFKRFTGQTPGKFSKLNNSFGRHF